MAIVQFESLLYNRQFLFVLVRMVDSNAGISTSERSTLSSLLISVMSRDMVFCSEVVFTLLSAHIQQLAQNKSTVGLLFRRSDSLAEKLFQHWLTLTLYPALLEPNGPGRQLFLFYKALKYQCEKGPIDICNNNARYSLSEQKLLRETVDCSPVTLMILPIAGFDQAPVPLRVLDCDTILQVKMKLLDFLYRNTPFSKRMTTDQFDLGSTFLVN
jgi:plexin A